MNRIAVNGKLIEQNSKSEMHRDNTNAVVACVLSFGHRSSAMIVIKFPLINKYVLPFRKLWFL